MFKKNKQPNIRWWLAASGISLGLFLYGFINEVYADNVILYTLLTIGLTFKILHVLFEWYHYVAIKPAPSLQAQREWTVDILTTSCPEEPREMIENTLRAMVAVEYPHENFLCDEGNDPWLQELCQQLSVHYITRQTRENAKAGNINNGLRQATGELCVILDPDHVPAPGFFENILPHFENPQVGYVQVVQAYKNQSESLVARAAAEQTYLFYGPLMRGMNEYGTAQAIGANCTFRREALDSIGGHAAGLTEDMHTSMLLHAKGWKSVFVPAIVSRGLVPSSISAYYKQQLKWSRGTFDLWLHVLPRIFSKLTWTQRLHYSILPLYYLFGFITLLDITVPVYSLLTGDYPWQMNPAVFFLYFTPYFIGNVLVRFYARRWLYEPQERGLHLLGGILRTGTWWIYITGFVYTLLNIKVPYIPTPKEHNSKNEFLLSLPNFIVAILCILAASYGLYRDWQPYSFLMAGFVFFNAIVLLLAVVIGQSAWISRVKSFLGQLLTIYIPVKWKFSYAALNRATIPFMVVCPITISFVFIFSFKDAEKGSSPVNNQEVVTGETAHFYTGIYIPSIDKGTFSDIEQAQKEVDHTFSVISTYLAWSNSPLPKPLWKNITQKGAIPMITWEPWTNLFPEYANHPELSSNRRVFHYITEGYFDKYIDTMAVTLRSLGYPVYLRFAHEMDNPMYPWSVTGGNTPQEFIAAWRYVYTRFEALGVQNVTWVWNPLKPSALDTYFPNGKNYPDSRYVDWIGITCLNYGKANADGNWYTFEQLYNPFRTKFRSNFVALPVMLTEFGSTSYGGDATQWVKNGLQTIHTSYPEIKSAVLFYSDQDKNWVNDWRPVSKDKFIKWTYELPAITTHLSRFDVAKLSSFPETTIPPAPKNSLLTGTPGNFNWMINGKPFYFKGICYNPAHDWRDGFYPLSRKQLEKDFSRIKAMGANTIRRYEPSIYDRNILAVAEEQGLYVMYGFWFDPAIDYYKDTAAIAAYEEKVLRYINKYKDRKNIIAWNIGNESWGLMKKHFTKPYLTLTRRAYLNFLERLTQKIHQIDPGRPVFASEEHEYYQLASTSYEMHKYVPSVDIIGINAYFEPNLKKLQSTFLKFDSLRPYVVTEFGPNGYWSEEFSDFQADTLLIEVSSVKKARWYERQWNSYIANNAGYNLGGFAFSWHDRYEGSATWFGITDFKGRLKPAYYYLQRAWKGSSFEENAFADLSIVGSWYTAKAGETIWLAAGISNTYTGNLSFEWEVLNQDTWKPVPIIENIKFDDEFAEIQIPDKKGNYRVYLHAKDSLGNVVTASRPLLVD